MQSLLPQIQSAWNEFIGTAGGKFTAFAVLRPIVQEADPDLLAALTDEQRKKYRQFNHPGRRKQWSESRRTELELRSRLGARARVTLSHAGEAEDEHVLGLGLEGGAALGIGVDLEKSSRKASPELVNRLVGPSEEGVGLALLEFWVVKEACFKACPENEGTVVWEYRIEDYDPSTGVGTARPPQAPETVRCRFRLLPLPGWLVAMAYSYRV